MTTLAISEARKELNQLPKRLAKAHEAIGITQNGKPVMAIMDWDFYETVIESLEVLGDEVLFTKIKKGIQELRTGKGIAWAEAKKELGL